MTNNNNNTKTNNIIITSNNNNYNYTKDGNNKCPRGKDQQTCNNSSY